VFNSFYIYLIYSGNSHDVGLKGCWIGCRTGEGKGEGLGEPGERTYMKKWNGGTYSTEIWKTGKRGKQDAVNNKAAYIYIYIYIYIYYTASGIITLCRWPSGAQVGRGLCTGWPPIGVTIPDAIIQFDLLMMSTQCSKHVETYNKLIIKQDFVH